jgi:hypothetical protein
MNKTPTIPWRTIAAVVIAVAILFAPADPETINTVTAILIALVGPAADVQAHQRRKR